MQSILKVKGKCNMRFGSDWNGNGRTDAFDHYMNMNLIKESADDDYDVEARESILDSHGETAVSCDEDDGTWRSDYVYDERYNIDPNDYDSEHEYLEVLEKACAEADLGDLIASEIDTREDSSVIISSDSNNELKRTNLQKYLFCMVCVKFPTKPYFYYLFKDIQLNTGDRVIIPLGNENKETEAVVVAVGECLACALPCGPDKMKYIIRKEDTETLVVMNASVSAGSINAREIVYEDDHICVSFIKWERNEYIIGGIARTATFIFENKSNSRLCIFMKDVCVGGFLNIAETHTSTLDAGQKEVKSLPFIYEDKCPMNVCLFDKVEFKVCYGEIGDRFTSVSLIRGPKTESSVISMKLWIQ